MFSAIWQCPQPMFYMHGRKLSTIKINLGQIKKTLPCNLTSRFGLINAWILSCESRCHLSCVRLIKMFITYIYPYRSHNNQLQGLSKYSAYAGIKEHRTLCETRGLIAELETSPDSLIVG